LLLISFIYQCGIDIGGIDDHYTCMALVVGRYDGLLTRRSHIFRGGMHDIYFPGARGIEIHEVLSC